jgi:triosephosphate isomerase (TIM)
MARSYIIAGNWKMYKTVAEGRRFIADLEKAFTPSEQVQVLLFVPFTALHPLAGLSTALAIGAQNMHPETQGAFTGEVSPTMLAELVSWVLIGHSERRELFGEDDAFINRKLRAALEHGLRPVLCVGETLPEREAGRTMQKLQGQLEADLAGLDHDAISRIVIAYEPIWAIGTGRNATPQQAEEVHRFIKEQTLARHGLTLPVLYGGSVKPDNSREILSQADVDGVLVGGASLKPDSFSGIISHSQSLSSPR